MPRPLPWLLLALCACQTDERGVPAPNPWADHGCEGLQGPGGRVVFHADADGDGFGDPATRVEACLKPPGWVQQAGDCDDQRATAHPGAEERCNEHDDDCDGQVDEDDAVDTVRWLPDADGDGFGGPDADRWACQPGPGWVPPAELLDCDDGEAEVHPGAVERCNGRDDDCDGQVDGEGTADLVTWYRDADGDGFGRPDQGLEACAAPPGWVEPAPLADCDDGAAAIHPGATELCNGLDDDCDGQTDEDDAFDAVPWYADTDGDHYGDAAISVIACRPPEGYVSSPGDCDDLRATSFLGATELCNGLDDDCDGVVDQDEAVDASTWYADADGDGFGDPAQPRQACRQPRGFRSNHDDCDDEHPDANPRAVEVCNGRDDDCDGVVDEPEADDAITWYPDGDRDGYGDRSHPLDACYQPSGYVSPAGDCDDADPAVHPGAGEPLDGIDNDCDGRIDEPTPEG